MPDLIEDICKRLQCEYLLATNGDCQLLRDEPLQRIFTVGTCEPYDRLLKPAVGGQLKQYDDLLDVSEYLNEAVDEIAGRLMSSRLDSGHSILFLKKYLNTSAAREVCRIVVRALREQQFVALDDAPASATASQEIDTGLLDQLIALLAARAQRTPNKQHERQYVVFVSMVHHLRQGFTRRAALEAIAGTLDVHLMTIYRDLAKIQDYFVQKNVIDASLHYL